ncbi:hypothetical protein EI94DRAFT_1730458 [Lactarius quietus]|nr:hypothetical protein EI94DRAFT_1730458 [Lactarius quietus]
MGNTSSRNDHLPIPPGYVPPTNYTGYYQPPKTSTWNPFKRNKMKKREKALREYLYTTPMILQYPNAFTVTHPGHNLVQQGMPQIQSIIPVAPANGFAPQVGVPLGAPMGVTTTGDPSAAPAPATTATATAAGVPQMMPMAYPAALDYSAYPDLRSAMASFFPRRSHRSQRRNTRSHHRSRRRSPSPSEESSADETMSSSYGSPSSYDSAVYPRDNRRHRRTSQRDRAHDREPYQHHRSGSTRNPLPRPPKDVLASTPFRPLLSQLPSANYSSWGPASTGVQPPPPPVSMQMPQAHPAPPQPPRRERGMGLFRRRRDTRFGMPSLNAAAQSFNTPGMSAMHMPIPDAQPAAGRTPGPGTTPILPPVIPSSAQMMPMRMPEADQQQQQQEQPPVFPPGMGPGSPAPNRMSMPSTGQAGSTPFIPSGGLMTPGVVPGVMPSAGGPGMPGMGSAQAMHMSIGASPAAGPMSMPTAAVGPMGMGMGMPSPGGAGVGPGGVVPTLRFNGYGEHSGFLYHSPHRVMYEDELYPTALHLFEALKFLPHRPDLAEQIRLCEHVEEVTEISASYADNTRRDWGNVALTTMDERLRGLLLSTAPADLIYVESGDTFWGDGAGAGMNELGKSLMRVRERLRSRLCDTPHTRKLNDSRVMTLVME